MFRTYHISKRMTQRGIKNDFLEAVKDFGVVERDKIRLTKKNCEFISQEINYLIKTLEHISDKNENAVLTFTNSHFSACKSKKESNNK